MSVTELLNEIRRLPLDQQNDLKRRLFEGSGIDKDLERARAAFSQTLVDEGFLVAIPPGDDEDDDFEPVEFIGEPLSVTIINERR